MTWIHAAAACLAFSLAVAATPLVRRLALAIGAVDQPDGWRKIHDVPTARLGGVGLGVAFFGALFAFKTLFGGLQDFEIWRLLVPATAVLAVGVWDDIGGSRPRVKLLLQCLAALCFWLLGFRLERIFGGAIPWYASLAATVVWLVACANAVNLFDGMDGLATGLGIFASLMLFILSLYQGKPAIAGIACVLTGACAGFLLFNFPPAVVFLGDSGSLFLGMMLGVLAIEGSFKSHVTFALLVPMLALGLPLLDTVLAVLRRVGRRVSIFTADKDHLHHRLIAAGFTRRESLVVMYGLIVVLGSVSLVVAFSNNVVAGLFIVAAGALIALVARFLGGGEFHDIGFFLFAGLGRRRVLAAYRRVLREGIACLLTAADTREIAERALADCRRFGFDGARIEWREESFASGALESGDVGGDTWGWNAVLRDGEETCGSLAVVKRGGSDAAAPEVLPIMGRYARALGEALSRTSRKSVEREGPQ